MLVNQQNNFAFSNHVCNLVVLYVCGMCLALFMSCTDPKTLASDSELIPPLSINHEHRGAFLGVWGRDFNPNSEKVWFVGGEVQSANESHSLIASFTQNSAIPQGILQLEHEQVGGVLWWAWGDQKDQVWAAGEQGTILRATQSTDLSQWTQESLMIADEAKEKLIIWGLWGTQVEKENDEAYTQVWAVGGSVRRGGPKGVLLKRNQQGQWTRVLNNFLPIESADDPLQGTNLYKIWGTQNEVWLIGEGSLVLKAHLQVSETGLDLVDWEKQTLDSERPELLFTISGMPSTEQAGSELSPWIVGGYAQGKAWYWGQNQWKQLDLPQVPSLNGIAVSQDLIVASGQQGLVLAWPNKASGQLSQSIEQQWVQGAESMTLHSIWPNTEGKFWIVGGDLSTMQTGVIIGPQAWQNDASALQVQVW